MNNRRPIFIIEDNDDDFELLQRLLTKAEVPSAIDRATSGNVAIQRLEGTTLATAPSLLLTDLSMPDGDGFEFLTWARPQTALRETLLVVLSSTRRGADIDRAYSLGAHFFLSKFPTPEIIARLSAAAERRDLALHARIAPFRSEDRVLA